MDKLMAQLADAVQAFSDTADGPVKDSEAAIDGLADTARAIVAAWTEHGPALLGGLGVLRELVDMKLDGEIDDDGDEYVLENDDAHETVTSLVGQARELLGVAAPPRYDDENREET